jgi:hypothetical protein
LPVAAPAANLQQKSLVKIEPMAGSDPLRSARAKGICNVKQAILWSAIERHHIGARGALSDDR